MLEIDARCGLGRKGRWTRGERTLTTPLVLFLQGGARAAPSYAEGLLVSERTEDPRFQVRVGGSFFAPRPANDPDDLPAAKGIPLALADLEIPHEAVAGDWAVVSGESDLVAAKAVPGVFIANGPEFERSPREFVSAIREVREILGPAKVVAVTGLATPSNPSVLAYAGIDVVDSRRMRLGSARRRRRRPGWGSSGSPAPRPEAGPGRAAATAVSATQSWRVRIPRPFTRSSSRRPSA